MKPAPTPLFNTERKRKEKDLEREVRFTLTPNGTHTYMSLANPGASQSLASGSVSVAWSDANSSTLVKAFTPATSGTYYLEIRAYSSYSGQSYTLSVLATK